MRTMAFASSFSLSSHLSLSSPSRRLLPSPHSFSLAFSSFPTGKTLPCRCSDHDRAAPASPAPAAITASVSPGVDPKKGVSVYKPKSYQVLVDDAAASLGYALQDGITRLEIDFP